MASTTRNPISIVVSDKKWGTVVWTPSSHGQKHLRSVPEQELPDVIDLLEASLQDHLRGVNGTICDAVGHVTHKRVEALVALESPEALATGGLSGTDNPSGPFVHPVGI